MGVKGKLFGAGVFAIAAVFIIAASISRFQEVNSGVSDIGQSIDNIEETDAEQGFIRIDYVLNEEFPLEGLRTDKGDLVGCVFCRVSDPRIESEGSIQEKHPDWGGVPYDAAYQKYDAPLFLQVDFSISNNSDEDFAPLWPDVESGSWSNVRYKDLMLVENNADAASDFIVPAGQARTFVLTYQLWEPTFSSSQWMNVRSLDYSIVFLSYPTKISVALGAIG